MAEKTKADAAMNVGQQITLADGRKVRVRELSWKALKTRARDVYGLVVAVKDANPDVDWTAIGSSQAIEIVFASLPAILEGAADLVGGVVADASGLTDVEIDDLGLSDFQRVLIGVIEEQGTAIEDFFSLRDAVKGMVADNPSGNGSTETGKPTPSQPSLPTDSVSQK